jgi:hypothetical protein
VEPAGGQAPSMAHYRGSEPSKVYTNNLMISGKCPNTVSEFMQMALHKVESWCRAEVPPVIPNKMELLLFTKRKEANGFIESVRLHRVIRPTGHEVSAVILDAQLTWRQHVK